MGDDTETATSLCRAIVEGTFPQSEQLLTSDLSSETIAALLAQISQTRHDLSNEIKANTQDEFDSVDQWITRAKKAQEDIARCKLESKRIVEEHQHLEALKDQATDYQRKVGLLETEIHFTNSLAEELRNLSLAAQSLKAVEDCLAQNDPSGAATKLQEVERNPATKSKSRTTTLLCDLRDELRLKTRFQLEAKLDEQVLVRREQNKGRLEIRANELDSNAVNSDTILRSLDSLGDGQDSTEPLTDKLRSLIIQPLRRSARLKLSAYQMEEFALDIELSTSQPSIDLVLDLVLDFLNFLQNSVSQTVQEATSEALLSELMDVLVSDWLNPELPTDLGMLDGLDKLEQRVVVILEKLKSMGWRGQPQLQGWMEDIQRAWLNKRKAATLDAVRAAFASAKGQLRQVERVERQVVSTVTEDSKTVEEQSDDWDANWDESNDKAPDEAAKPKSGEDDDTDGWGFDDDEDDEKEEKPDATNGDSAKAEDDNGGDAWGWGDGDESPVTEQQTQSSTDKRRKAPNGTQSIEETEKEITMTEVYSISEIPDHLIEIVGRDLSDSQTVRETQHESLDSVTASRGLLALPTLALAMFRATAPSYYGASPSLTDFHRYNDSLYIAERLRDISAPLGMPSMESDIKSLEKFAKMAYSKEMETQRIIIWDLLEGAQGFTSCTQFPYSQEIENAVSSVTDRIRTLRATWKPILSTSALMQSLGSLVTMVITKVISSIEEMDDISEPESQRLTLYCQQIATLEDLFFSAPPPATTTNEDHPQLAEEVVPMTAVYVSNWLRFQYLINILESSLVDIKYLWTEGELSLEFSAEEVTDLIKALFAESAHRRGAIAAIKGNRTSPRDETRISS